MVSVVHTNGLRAYRGLDRLGYKHEIRVLQGQEKDAAGKLLPRIHLAASLLKRWLMGIHRGAVSTRHLDYYLDEFTCRFNRRTSVSFRQPCKIFWRLDGWGWRAGKDQDAAIAVASVCR